MKAWGSRFFGVMPNAAGSAPTLIEAGWLPRRRAAEAMGISVAELDRRAAERVVRSRAIGPAARLYEVIQTAKER